MNKRIIFLCLLTMVLIVGIFMPNNYHVRAEDPFPEDEIKYKNSVTIDGVKRTLYVLKNTYVYFQIGNEKPFVLTLDTKDVRIDQSSTVWVISSFRIIFAWNYDLCKNTIMYGIPDPTGKNAVACEGEDFICDDNDYAVGFKLSYSDAVHPTLTVDELKELFPPESESDDPTSTPSAEPSAKPDPSVEPQPSPVPQVSPTPKPSPSSPTKKPEEKKKKEKTSVKGKCLYKGKKLLCKYTIKNNVLIFKVPGRKTFRRSAVKEAKYIEKSNNLVYVTVKGSSHTRSLNGKNKCILKKNAKKIFCENKWAVKLKKVHGGFVNIRKK